MTAFRHDALLYGDADEFVEHALPFVRDGIACGDRVLAVTSTANAEALQEALGPQSSEVDCRDSRSWYESPGRAFRAYADYVANAGGRYLRAIGEPVWPLASREAVIEWARYESVLNVSFAGTPAWIVCPYDVASLPDGVVDHARHTHPTLHVRGRRVANSEFVEPAELWAALDRSAPLVAPAAATPLEVTSDLAGLRAAVAARAELAGVDRARIPELLVAVHELAINALSHGGGRATIRTWVDRRDFVCQIDDEGPGLASVFGGYQVPGPSATRGRGLWLARQLCDVVEIRSTARGTRIRIRIVASRAA